MVNGPSSSLLYSHLLLSQAQTETINRQWTLWNTGIVDFREKLSRSRFNLAAEKIRPIITKSGFANYHDDGVIYGHMADVSWKRATDCSRVSIEEARALKRSRKRKS
ncbi:hypothetical protein HZH68_002848 [Vespula germanica]|uniref:Uncharacterized protein n=1 Tax=Vespula germanica TaxID=30212 RepID=A0A834U1Z8_VESGE|nr:hypothetical protein HZH68_002848 [Vespula germanica]